jgi:predicted DNA-binding ribbon-helix-helix protein
MRHRSSKQARRKLDSPIRKRAIYRSGVKTSASLEEPFWEALEEIAQASGSTRAAVINAIAREQATGNFSSTLRVFALEHFRARAFHEEAAPEPTVRPVLSPRHPPRRRAKLARGNAGLAGAGRKTGR